MSVHVLITGTSLSGKSTLAKKLAALHKTAGRQVIVLDEMMDPEWEADFVTDNEAEFLKVFWNNRNLSVFIDEAGDSVGRYNKSMSMTARRGRHWGHIIHYMTQRASLLDRNVTSQCGEVFAFLCEPDDSDALAKRFVQPALRQASDLNQGEYIHAIRFGKDRKPYSNKGDVFADN